MANCLEITGKKHNFSCLIEFLNGTETFFTQSSYF